MPSTRCRLLGSLEALQIDAGAASGILTDSRLALENDTFESFGWGVAFNGFHLNAKFEGDGPLSAEVECAYRGLLLYLHGSH